MHQGVAFIRAQQDRGNPTTNRAQAEQANADPCTHSSVFSRWLSCSDSMDQRYLLSPPAFGPATASFEKCSENRWLERE